MLNNAADMIRWACLGGLRRALSAGKGGQAGRPWKDSRAAKAGPRLAKFGPRLTKSIGEVQADVDRVFSRLAEFDQLWPASFKGA